MGKIEDRRSKRSKRQKPARFASPTESVSSPSHGNPTTEAVEAAPVQTPVAKSSPQSKAVEAATPKAKPTVQAKASTPQATTSAKDAAKTKGKKRRNSDTSSDEERWLNAIETGKLEDVDDELKKIKDPKLMTARQRAMYERTQDTETALAGFTEELIALPSGYREKEKPQTAEDIQKAALKSQKRKQQADERREKDKQKTMERLLKKQESSKQRSAARNKQNQKLQTHPTLTYVNNLDGTYILVPANQEFPLKPQTAQAPPPVQLCGVKGCGNRKVYSCSKTKVPLCSLACYQKNLSVA